MAKGSKIVPVRFPDSELYQLDTFAAAWKLNRSDVIRLALDKLFRKAYHNPAPRPRTHEPSAPEPADGGGPPPPTASPAPSPLAPALDDELDSLMAELDES